MDELRGVKLPIFNGGAEDWPVFYLRFKKAVKSIGLHNILTIEGAKLAKEEDENDFDKNDARIQSMLLNQLLVGAVHLVEDCKTAAEMIARLREQYESSSAASVLFQFNKALDISYKDGAEMSDHLGELNTLVNQIRQAGDINIDKLHVVLMLRSIPKNDNWQAVITNLKAQPEDMLTKEKVAKVLTERALELRGENGQGKKPSL